MYVNVIDFEATTKNPNTAEPITCYIETFLESDIELLNPIDSLYVEMRPEVYIDEAFEFHKIPRHVADKFPHADIGMRKVYTHLKKYPSIVVLHANKLSFGVHGYYDWQLFRSYCARKNVQDRFYRDFRSYEIRSTHTMAKERIYLKGYSLDKVAAHFCIKFEHHNCIQDVKTTIKIYRELQKHGISLFDFMEEKWKKTLTES